MYFIAKVTRGLIRDSLLMNHGSDWIATHQTIPSPSFYRSKSLRFTFPENSQF